MKIGDMSQLATVYKKLNANKMKQRPKKSMNPSLSESSGKSLFGQVNNQRKGQGAKGSLSVRV